MQSYIRREKEGRKPSQTFIATRVLRGLKKNQYPSYCIGDSDSLNWGFRIPSLAPAAQSDQCVGLILHTGPSDVAARLAPNTRRPAAPVIISSSAARQHLSLWLCVPPIPSYSGSLALVACKNPHSTHHMHIYNRPIRV